MTTEQKQKALFEASKYITRVLKTRKPFMNFDYIYGTGVLFKGLTREEVEDIYNILKT